jgi:replication factor C large subunit
MHIFTKNTHKKSFPIIAQKSTNIRNVIKGVTKKVMKQETVSVISTTPTTNTSDSWCEIYRPLTTGRIVGQQHIIKRINDWVISYEFTPTHNMCILWGKCGTGKTTLAHAVLRQHKYRIVEVNASMVRTYNDTMLYLTETCLRADFLNITKTAVIFDEIDGAIESDKGNSITAIRDFLKRYQGSTISPIICICNEVHKHSIRTILFPISLVLKLKPLTFQQLFSLAQYIIKVEHIIIEHNKISQLIYNTHGDARQLIYYLQMHNIKSMDSKLQQKDNFDDVFSVAKQIFSTTTPTHIHNGDKYLNGLLFENYVANVHDLDELSNCADAFSCVDIMKVGECTDVLMMSMPTNNRMQNIKHVSKEYFKSYTGIHVYKPSQCKYYCDSFTDGEKKVR